MMRVSQSDPCASTYAAEPAMTVREQIANNVKVRGTRQFLVDPQSGRTVSFAQLDQFCRRLCAHLQSLGLEKGDKVASLLNNGVFTAELFLATMYGGFVAVPLNVVTGPTAIIETLVDSGSTVIFVSQACRGLWDEIKAEVRGVKHVIDCDEAQEPQLSSATLAPALYEIDHATDALLAYTSGSTGRPKGALFTQCNVVCGGINTAVSHNLTDADASLLVLPLYHMNAQIVTLMSTLVSGGSVVVPTHFAANTFWNLVINHQCTWFALVPTIVTQLIEQARRERACNNNLLLPVGARDPQLKHVRFARSSSAPLSPAAQMEFEELFCMPIIEAMGMTEAGGAIFSNPPPPAERKVGSPGIPYGFEVRILDEQGNPVTGNQVGEITLRGPSVMKGYFKMSAQDRITQDGFVRTGDLGRQDEDGFIFIAGRISDVIKKGGEKIAPREIEELILSHSAVLECAIVSVPDAVWGEDLVAYVALRPGHACTALDLSKLCQQTLGELKTPGRFEFISALPRRTAHKVDRNLLSTMARQVVGNAEQASGVGNQAIERKVIETMQLVLKLPKIDKDENFFDLGGYSLLSLKLLSKLANQFSCHIPAAVLFSRPTAAGLASYLASQSTLPSTKETDAQTSLILLSEKAQGQPVFIAPGGTGGEEEFFVYARMVRNLGDKYACYGLRSRASIPGVEAHASVEEMARDYLVEVRAVQPHGPYYILGECTGGVIGYEMARQLEQAGQTVRLLALLDSRAPDVAFEFTERLGWFLSSCRRRLSGGKKESTQDLAQMADPLKRDKARDARWVSYKKPLLRYRPGSYKGKLVLLYSEEYWQNNVQSSWNKVKVQDKQLIQLQGDHYAYIRENAARTALVLAALLGDGESGVKPLAVTALVR